MATYEERIAAAVAALSALTPSVTDPAEAERGVALIWSQFPALLEEVLANLPAPAPVPSGNGVMAATLIGFDAPADDPALAARILAHRDETLAISRAMLKIDATE